MAASHLPDAALHIGKVVINQNQQFTTNLSVTLAISAVDTGSGISAMQISTDGQTWSAPESYKTARLWQLLDAGDYPPTMNTTLKTVYVRFRSGTGKWTKAVSDSIILAKSPSDIPKIEEVWITQARPSDYDPLQPLGSRRNPHVVPRTDNELQFDTLMHRLMTNYSKYRAAVAGTNVLQPATNATVVTIRLGSGVYETHGDSRAGGDALAWSPSDGWRIIGAGKSATTLKAVHFGTGWHWLNVIGSYNGLDGWYSNFEISDLTVDANLHEGGSNYQLRFAGCMSFVGNNVQIRRVKAKNGGTTIPGAEGGLIGMHNFGEEEHGTYNLVIEDCDLVQPQVGNAYRSGIIGISGQYGESGRMHDYHNVVVRNCYIDGAAYDGDILVDRTLYHVRDRGVYGILMGGARNAMIEDNLIVDVVAGCYLDSVSVHDVHVRSNQFRNVCLGFDLQLGTVRDMTNRLQDTYRFEGNQVELDPRFFPAGDTWGTVGWRLGFRTIGDRNGPDDYIFNQLIIENNTFQFTDQKSPEASVGAQIGILQAFRTAQVRSNVFRGPFTSFKWDNGDSFLDRQVDIVDTTRSPPLNWKDNRWQDGTIVEPYPYVLDNSLPRPVVIAGQEVSFPLPVFDGKPATLACGIPTLSPIDATGRFRWRPAAGDVGKYVVSFYASTNRLQDPRRTIVTVLPPHPADAPEWFANGLTGLWRFEETTGWLLSDSSGNGGKMNVYGTLAGGRLALGAAGLSPGSSCLRLNSLPNLSEAFGIPTEPMPVSGLPAAYHPLLNSTTNLFHPFSLSFWMKTDSAPASAVLLAGRGRGYYLDLKPGTTNAGLLSVGLGNWTGDLAVLTPPCISTGAWHQIAAVYDGVGAALYVNGQLSGRDSFGQFTGWDAQQGTWFGGGFGWGTFSGYFDEVALWNRALNAEEIGSLFEQQRAGVSPPVTPLQPSALIARFTPSGKAELAWIDNSSNESGFLLERSLDGMNFSVVAGLGSNTTSFSDTLPTAGGTYTYRIAATNSFGTSGFANFPAPGEGPPPPPRSLVIFR